MSTWHRFLFSFFNLSAMAGALPAILHGILTTIELGVLIVLCGIALGLILALLRSLRWRVLNWAIVFVVDLLRAVPPLVILVLLYFGLPSAGIEISSFLATFLGLTCVLAAFAEEILWAAIRAVPPGQSEAARALGLHRFAIFRLVVLPQALRLAVPPLTNRTIAIIKNTALGSVVGVSEILGAAQASMAFSGNPSPLVLAVLAYTILFLPVVVVGRWIERRASWGTA